MWTRTWQEQTVKADWHHCKYDFGFLEEQNSNSSSQLSDYHYPQTFLYQIGAGKGRILEQIVLAQEAYVSQSSLMKWCW